MAQNAVSLVEFNRRKMVINPALLLPLPEPSPQLLAQLQPLLKSQVRRIYEFDLTEDADDYWCEDGEYEVRRLSEVGGEAHAHEVAPCNESPAPDVESDEAYDFDVFARDESLHGDHSSMRANMWDDPDGHVSEGACAEDDCSECSLDESSLWYDVESIEEAGGFDSDCSCDEELIPRLCCRAVIEEVPSEPDRVEVILDSGANCTVLPVSYQAVGHKDSSVSKSILLDAQGNKIEGGESRVFVNFEIDTPDEDSVISFKDSVVLGNVQQPLFCLGKLMKRGWVPVCDEYDSWCMQKGEAWFPVHWSRNSFLNRLGYGRPFGDASYF